ncbi:MAG: DUF4157 domain-containing protein [Acidobacteriota bacterium]
MPENPLSMLNVPPSINEGARETRLPKPLRAEMEKSYNADFSSVRIMESHVPTLNGSKAYTSGDDIHFAPGHFDPHTDSGRQLISHEIAHVVQQRGGREAAVNAPLIEESASQ